MDKKYSIELTLEELLPIDGKVSIKAQEIIDKAKKEFTYGFELPIMNEILRNSETSGNLKWTYKQIKCCNYCDKNIDYYTYPRSGRYHNKGDKNYDKPKYYSGIAFNEGFITFKGYGDMCTECALKYNVIKRLIDYIIDNDLKIQIQKNDYRYTKYIKDSIRICYNCNNEIQESEMGRKRTLMGDGTFPNSCPHCGAESLLFGKNHESTNKFVMIKNPAFNSEVIINKLKDEVINFNNVNNIKVKLFEVYNKPNQFIIWTTETNNKEIINFDVVNKNYKKNFGFKKEHDIFEKTLINNGYKEI